MNLPDSLPVICLKTDMNKRLLFRVIVTAMSAFLLAGIALAQGRQSVTRTTTEPRPASMVRNEVLALIDEFEALAGYLSNYTLGRSALQDMGYDDYKDLQEELAGYRKQVRSLSEDLLTAMDKQMRHSKALVDLTSRMRNAREDQSMTKALDRYERYINRRASDSGADTRSAQLPGGGSPLNSRATATAVNYIKPACKFDELDDYPSADPDIAAPKGIAFTAEVVYEALPPNIEIPIPVVGGVIKIPQVGRIIATAAWGTAAEILNGLEAAREEAKYCEALAFTIEGALSTDDPATISLVLDRDDGGYLDYVRDLVTAVIDTAEFAQKPIKINCAKRELSAANAFYSGGKYLEAYKKYRSAYAQVGNDSCEIK